MINFDALKEFDVTALGEDAPALPHAGRELPVADIYPDPDNVRTHCSEETIAQLAETIRAEGLLQAITVRTHPQKPGCYLISYGERRWRAVRLLGLSTIRAVVDERFDPYRQAIENLQREDLTPLQIALFIAKRVEAGDILGVVADRLGKARSYVYELSCLLKAPPIIRAAFEAGRIDTRTAYLLVRHYPSRPEQIDTWLKGEESLSRRMVERKLAGPMKTLALRNKNYNALAVLVGGRPATLMLQPGSVRDQATVCFEDGSEAIAPLREITLTQWLRI